MKLRLRSMEARGAAAETHRVDLPPTTTLADVKALLAAKLSAAQPIPAESVRLSLNRSEEFVSPDPAATLPAIGLASGDLVYFTLSPLTTLAPQAQALPRNPSPGPGSVPISKAVDCGKGSGQLGTGGSSPQVQAVDAKPSVPAASDPPDAVMADAVDATRSWSSFVIGDLKRAMENVGGAGGTIGGRLVAALHAALLDAGFLAASPHGSPMSLPRDWPSGATVPLAIKYTIPELSPMLPVAEEGNVAVLNFSLMGNFLMVYGYVPGAQSEVRRLCLELLKLEPLLYLDSDQLSRVQESDIVDLWRLLKDEMCLPLIISLCQLNGLRLPPCLMTLPAELKTKILEFVPGVDLARVECTCKELRNIAADDDLWKKSILMLKVYGEGSVGSMSSKARFAEAWTANKRRQKRPSPSFWNYGWGNNPYSPHRLPVIGGDLDRLPFLRSRDALGQNIGNQRRNMSPQCNLDGRRHNFL